MTTTNKERLEKFELLIRIIGIIMAGFWAYFIFYYEKTIEPQKQLSFLNLESKIEKVGKKGKFDAYKVSISIKNNSKVREKILASWFHIVGVNLDFNINNSDTAFYIDNLRYLDSARRFSRFCAENIKITRTIETGKLYEEVWINPEQQFSTEFITFCPRDRYQTIVGFFYTTTVKNAEKVDVRWAVLKENGEVVPEFGINLGNDDQPDWQLINDVSHSRYIKEYDMVFTRQITELFVGQNR